MLSIASIPSSKPLKHYLHQLQQYPMLNGLVKFGVAFPFTYHYLGGEHANPPVLDYIMPPTRCNPCIAPAHPLLPHNYYAGLRHIAWDHIIGQNMLWVRNSGWAATGVAAVVGVAAAVTEFKE